MRLLAEVAYFTVGRIPVVKTLLVTSITG